MYTCLCIWAEQRFVFCFFCFNNEQRFVLISQILGGLINVLLLIIFCWLLIKRNYTHIILQQKENNIILV